MAKLTASSRKAIKAADDARRFPVNTCSASRHTQEIGEALVKRQACWMIANESTFVGKSLLWTVAALWDARTEIADLRAKLGLPPRGEEAVSKQEKPE